jgi:mannose-6-phosphate isomerase-like protein (cupin superfamily)
MNAQLIPKEFQHTSPAGAEVRLLMGSAAAGLAHCTLRKGTISNAVAHKTVSEFWHVISGSGEIWRRQGKEELITSLSAGVTIDIPLGTDFQYRSAKECDLVFICFTTPPWPGADEVSYLAEGAWRKA